MAKNRKDQVTDDNQTESIIDVPTLEEDEEEEEDQDREKLRKRQRPSLQH